MPKITTLEYLLNRSDYKTWNEFYASFSAETNINNKEPRKLHYKPWISKLIKTQFKL
jgi:hypothetical protein